MSRISLPNDRLLQLLELLNINVSHADAHQMIARIAGTNGPVTEFTFEDFLRVVTQRVDYSDTIQKNELLEAFARFPPLQ